MAAIISPKIPKKLPSFVDKKDTAVLFEHVEFPDNFTGLTNRLLMQILYTTGLRQAELLGLLKANIDFGAGTIRVVGKGSKERIIPVSKELQFEMGAYITARPKVAASNDGGCLLVLPNGKPLYPKYVYNVVHKYLSLVTTINKRSPHVLRHSFATHLSNSGADINAVKELLGHSSLAATQVYLHNNIEQLKTVHKLSHPKA